MKKIVLIFFLFINLSFSFGQWAVVGSEWHTGIIESISSVNQGYISTVAIGYAMIGSQNCSILESTHINSLGQVFLIDSAYTYSDSGKVYMYRNGSFYTLYDFSLSPADSWLTVAPYASPFTLSSNPPDTIVRIVIDSIAYLDISGSSKKALYVHSDQNDWHFLNPIIDDIGSAGGLYPFIYDWNDVDIPILRCFSNFQTMYQVDTSIDCTMLLNNVIESEGFNAIDIYPNPASNYIQFDLPESLRINQFAILNDFGNVIYTGRSEEIKESLSIGNYVSGIYIILFYGDSNIISKKFIISRIN